LKIFSVSVQTLPRDCQPRRFRDLEGRREKTRTLGQRPKRDLHVGGEEQAGQRKFCRRIEESGHQAERDSKISGSKDKRSSTTGKQI
jgi:hypothetical protein